MCATAQAWKILPLDGDQGAILWHDIDVNFSRVLGFCNNETAEGT